MQLLKKCFYVIVLGFCANISLAQESTMKAIPLDDLSEFRQQAGNWQIVGQVTMSPTLDVHQTTPPQAPEGKKNKKAKPAQAPPSSVTSLPGKGILLNLNDNTKKDALITTWEHGDIDLEMEVMLPKGSNSGVYLQGRYEVQLFDSWGVKNPTFSDIGGIYRNWEKEQGKIYMGKAPLSNASKAPGLWQTLKISFRAPKFDAQGNKIANARFTSVILNGVKIHDNIEVPLPTGGPIENNEKATGPLMIQGDHGPVAFRNIRYQHMKESNFELTNLSYKIFHGSFSAVNDFTSLKPVLTGTSKDLSIEVVDVDNEYGIIYNGNITVSDEAQYKFTIMYKGAGKLYVNKQPSEDGWGTSTVNIALKPGTYPFEIQNAKKDSWEPSRLAFFAEATNIYPQALHAFGSFPPDDNPTASIFLNPGAQPKLLRAFLDYEGKGDQRLTHTIGVGDPTGIHYVYDLKAGNLVCVWKGDFVDATPMWHDRGDGSFRPRGAAQYIFNGNSLAFLADATQAFGKPQEEQFKPKGYLIDESSNRPVFRYVYQGLEVDDKIYPDDNNRVITRDIQIKNRGDKKGLYFKLTEGNKITEMNDGYFSVDDKYYVKSLSGKPTVRDVNGKKELVLSVDGSNVKYSIIW